MEALGLPGFVFADESYQASLRYTAPLSQWNTWKHQVSLGGTTLAPTAAEVPQGVMAYNGQLPDRFGVTRFNLQAVYSPSDAGDKNTESAFARGRLPNMATRGSPSIGRSSFRGI